MAYAETENELAVQRYVLEQIHQRYNVTLSVFGKRGFVKKFIESKRVNEWTRLMMNGWYHRDLGWDVRGGGYAHEVAEEAWPVFQKELLSAEVNCVKAWELDPSKPESASMMIMNAKANDGSVTPREWFDRAIEAQFDYRPAYTEYLWTLRPRWGGAQEAMLAFAEECRDTKRWDTDVPLFYIESAWGIISEREAALGAADYQLRQTLYDEIDLLLAAASEAPARLDAEGGLVPPAQLQSARLNNAINSLDMGGDQRMNIEALADTLETTYDVAYSKRLNFGSRQKWAIDKAIVMTKETSELVDSKRPSAGEKYEQYIGKLVSVAETQRELSRTAEDARAKRYFERCAEETDLLTSFYKGEWVDLTFDEAYGAWNQTAGAWTRVSDSAIEGRVSKDTEGMAIWCPTLFPGSIEFEVDIEPLQFYGPQPRMGPMIGYLTARHPGDDRPRTPTGRCFWIDPLSGLIGADFWARHERAFRGSGPADRYKLNIKAWNGFYVVLLDDQFLFERRSEGFAPDGYIGLGCISHSRSSHDARFSNPRVRRLYYSAPPDTEDPDELIAYFDRVLAFHPEDIWGTGRRGTAHYLNENFTDAVADLAEVVRPNNLNGGLAAAYASSLAKLANYEEAIRAFEAQLTDGRDKDHRVLNGLAWLLASCPAEEFRDGARALTLAQEASDATDYEDWTVLDTLAAAYAETGDFGNAVKWQAEAIALNQANITMDELEQRLALYQKQKPYHELVATPASSED